MKHVLVVIMMTAFGFGGAACSQPNGNPNLLQTRLHAIDGDTLEISGTLYDFPDIDAPELGQLCERGQRWETCGLDAAFELDKRLALGPQVCHSHQDLVSGPECQAFLKTLELESLDTGLAVTRPSAGSELQDAEAEARSVPLGIWRGKFSQPVDWRAGQRLANEPTDNPCPIFLIQQNNHTVYVVPTDEAYKDLEIHLDKVTGRLCSDAEARQRGFQRFNPGHYTPN